MRRRVEQHVIGLDLSLRAAAACAIPLGWDFDLEKVRMLRTGWPLVHDATDADRIDRIIQIRHDVHVFIISNRAIFIGIEDYAFSAGRQSHARELAELGGHVKASIRDELDHVVKTVTASRARKVLLQHVPQKGGKEYTRRNVTRLGGRALKWTEDEVDAFVIANYMLMIAGGVAMTFEGE